jgi:competence protein ComEC
MLLAALLAMNLVPRAAFWVPTALLLFCGVVCFLRRARAMGACLCVAAVLALGCFCRTALMLRAPAESWCGKSVILSASVLENGTSYAEGMASATLRVTNVNGYSTSFLCRCGCLPECEAGQKIQGKFALDSVAAGPYRLSAYADGIFAQATYLGGFAVAGRQEGLRVWLQRLQRTMSAGIRRWLSPETGGILAAMTVGDRAYIPDTLQTAYQDAGIPHMLVVSGLHLSLLCRLIPLRRRKESWRARVANALAAVFLSLFLIGVTGAQPSIVRAGLAVILCSIGVLLGRPADALTSLALTGALMSAANGYAVCDIAFELSFAATAGVLLAGGIVDKWRSRRPENETQTLPKKAAWRLLENTMTAAGGALFTLPVLMLRGMNISAVSVLTNVATLWLISPILVCGLAAAVACFFPFLLPLNRAAAFCGGVLVRLLNALVSCFCRIPGAHLHTETAFPALVVLLVAGFLLAAWFFRLPARKTLLAAVLLVAVAFSADAGLSRGLVKIAMVGNARVPAVVITCDGEAEVLFRGGSYNARKVEEYLREENISAIKTLVDLRMEPSGACPLEGEQTICAANIADGDDARFTCGAVQGLCVRMGGGCYIWLMNKSYCIATVSGTPAEDENVYRVALFLATGSPPARVHPQNVMILRRGDSWLDSCGAQRVYYEQSGAAVWLRTGDANAARKSRGMGANGWPIW